MRTGADTITVPGGVYTIRGDRHRRAPSRPAAASASTRRSFVDWEGDYDIAGPLTITGAGAGATIVDGGTPPFGAPVEQTAIDRLFEIHPTRATSRSRGSRPGRAGSADEGGGHRSTARPASCGSTTSAVRDSFATAYGGGIYNAGPLDGICPVTCPVGDGRLELTASSVTGNSTGGEGGGVFIHGEHALRVAAAADARSRFRGNRADEGAAIFNGGEPTATGSRARVDVSRTRASTDNVALGDRRRRSTTGTRATSSSPTPSSTDNLAWDDGGAIDSGAQDERRRSRARTFDGQPLRRHGRRGQHARRAARRRSPTRTFTGNEAGVDLIDELGQFHEGEGGGGARLARRHGQRRRCSGSRFERQHGRTARAARSSIESLGTVLVADSAFRHNEAEISRRRDPQRGHAGHASAGSMITDNEALEAGGGIDNQGSGEFIVDDTTIARNTALDGGGFAEPARLAVARRRLDAVGQPRAQRTAAASTTRATPTPRSRTRRSPATSRSSAAAACTSTPTPACASINITITAEPRARPAAASASRSSRSTSRSCRAWARSSATRSSPATWLRPTATRAWGSEGGNIDGGTGCYFRGTARPRATSDPRLDAIADNGGADDDARAAPGQLRHRRRREPRDPCSSTAPPRPARRTTSAASPGRRTAAATSAPSSTTARSRRRTRRRRTRRSTRRGPIQDTGETLAFRFTGTDDVHRARRS